MPPLTANIVCTRKSTMIPTEVKLLEAVVWSFQVSVGTKRRRREKKEEERATATGFLRRLHQLLHLLNPLRVIHS